MNSKGWKLGLLVFSALAISACGQKKKNKPASPYTGIWMERSALRNFKAAGVQGSCLAVERSRQSGLAVKPFVIQSNGEVFTFSPDTLTRESFLGAINSASVFAATDGSNRRQMSSGFYSGDMEATALLPNSRLILEGGYLITSNYGQPRIFVPVSDGQARAIWRASALCADSQAQFVPPPVPMQPGQFLGPDQSQGYPQQHGRQQRPLNQDDK